MSYLRLHTRLRSQRGVHAHPCLLDEAEQLLHVRAPVVHHVLRPTLRTEVDDPRGPVDPRIDRAGDDQPRERLLRLLPREVEEGREAGERNSRVIL